MWYAHLGAGQKRVMKRRPSDTKKRKGKRRNMIFSQLRRSVFGQSLAISHPLRTNKTDVSKERTTSDTKVRTILTLVPAEQGRYRLKSRHLNFDPCPSRTCAGP